MFSKCSNNVSIDWAASIASYHGLQGFNNIYQTPCFLKTTKNSSFFYNNINFFTFIYLCENAFKFKYTLNVSVTFIAPSGKASSSVAPAHAHFRVLPEVLHPSSFVSGS